MFKFLISLSFFFIFSFSQGLSAQNQNQKTYKVIGVKDGDTIVVLMEDVAQSVRLANIDAPEKKQPFGTKAKQFVSDLCFGKMVQMILEKQPDRYGRLIAEIILPDGKNLNKELVKNGLAWHFKKYSKNETYAQLEIQARTKKVGLWVDPYPIAPWDWRKPKVRAAQVSKSGNTSIN